MIIAYAIQRRQERADLTSPLGQGPDGAGEAEGQAPGPNPRHSGGVGKGGGSAAGGGPVVGC